MAGMYSFFTWSDLLPYIQDLWPETELTERKYKELSELQQIYLLCTAFKDIVGSERTVGTTIGKNGRTYHWTSYSLGNMAKDNRGNGYEDSKQERILKFGFLLSTNIRRYLMQEQIYYSLAIHENVDGESVYQRSVQLTADQILRRTKMAKTKQSRTLARYNLQLSGSLKTFQSSNDNATKIKDMLYRAIEDWATVKHPEDPESGQRSTSDGAEWFQKSGKDTDVYFRYTKGKQQYVAYSYRKESPYNLGWIYEWFNEKYQAMLQDYTVSEINQRFLQSTHPISLIIAKQDRISGLAQGDYVDALGRQVQAKNNNAHITNLNTIMTLIDGIIVAVNELIDIEDNTNADEAKESFLKQIQILFNPGERTLNDKTNQHLQDVIQKTLQNQSISISIL